MPTASQELCHGLRLYGFWLAANHPLIPSLEGWMSPYILLRGKNPSFLTFFLDKKSTKKVNFIYTFSFGKFVPYFFLDKKIILKSQGNAEAFAARVN
jgi:hypothetical protein